MRLFVGDFPLAGELPAAGPKDDEEDFLRFFDAGLPLPYTRICATSVELSARPVDEGSSSGFTAGLVQISSTGCFPLPQHHMKSCATNIAR